jgi:16S rRNA (guanine527-N7)-methyltransferase
LSEHPQRAPTIPPPLLAALEMARQRGLLGAATPVAAHVAHARALGAALVAALGHRPRRLVDLGSGGGVPGLVLAVDWPEVEVVLLDAQQRPAEVLSEAIAVLGLERTEVLRGRAEALARDTAWREGFDGATSRSFGPPAVTAECASGFLALDGVLVVAEPPGAPARWDPDGLAALGLQLVAQQHEPVAVAALRKVAATPDTVPRGVGRPAKRPRW